MNAHMRVHSLTLLTAIHGIHMRHVYILFEIIIKQVIH